MFDLRSYKSAQDAPIYHYSSYLNMLFDPFYITARKHLHHKGIIDLHTACYYCINLSFRGSLRDIDLKIY